MAKRRPCAGATWGKPIADAWSALALAGAVLTGFGYSLVYASFGVEAIRRAPPQSQGLAMGAYTAFLDLTEHSSTAKRSKPEPS
jgi:hypothetical protein